MLVDGWQTPRPLQVRPLTAVDWFAGHDGPAHEVLASYRRHALRVLTTRALERCLA